jgi:hypothetical protein
MIKYAKDIVKNDYIILDCGYGPQESMVPCKVLSIDKPIPLFENDKLEDYIFFTVTDGSSTFPTIGFPPFYELEVPN